MALSKVGDQKLLQALNRTLVLNTIHQHGHISRIEIAKKTKLSQSTVSNVIDMLQKEGYIMEVGTGSSTRAGGRKPTILSFRAESGYMIAVAIITEAFHISLHICLYDLLLNLVAEKELAIHDKGQDLIDVMVAEVREFMSHHAEKPMIGIGFSVPTVLDSNGVIHRGHLLELENYPLEQELNKAFPSLPLVVEQEQHAAVLGERTVGPAKDADYLIYVTVGRGIGSSIIANNQLIRGVYGGAGEIGHISINKYGGKCICGKNGCLRLYATELAFINKIKEAVANDIPVSPRLYNPALDQINVREVYILALEGDSFCRDMLESLLDDLCSGLSNLIYLINPSMIVLGGNLLMAEAIVLPYVTNKLKEMMDSPTSEVHIVGTRLGKYSSVSGIASILFDKHFLKKEFMVKNV